jgi:hypothetical protein
MNQRSYIRRTAVRLWCMIFLANISPKGDAFFDIADTSAPWLDISGHLASTSSPLGLLDWGRSQLAASVVEELDYEAALADITTEIQNGGGIGDEIWLEMPGLGAVVFAELGGSVACPAIAVGLQRRYNPVSPFPTTCTFPDHHASKNRNSALDRFCFSQDLWKARQ